MYLSGCGCGGLCGDCETPGLGQSPSDPSIYAGDPGTDIVDSGSSSFQSSMGTVEAFTSLVPVVGQIAATAEAIFSSAYQAAEQFFGLHAGSNEANVIVPVQNQLMNYLGQITNNLVLGPSVPQLQAYLQILRLAAQKWIAFVSDSRFRDGRASEQAMNTIMPYFDGTCGYHWPPPFLPGQRNCLTWGDGTPGGPGTDGMIGAVQRAVIAQGGTPLQIPALTQGVLPNNIPSLANPLAGLPAIPQAGSIYPTLPTGTTFQIGGASIDLSIIAPIAVGVLWFMALRKRRAA